LVMVVLMPAAFFLQCHEVIPVHHATAHCI
jgi:hypothetical protein